MKKIMYLFIFLMLFTLVACGDVPETAAQAENTTTLTVGGMTCRRCVTLIRSVLSTLDGVTVVSLDFNSGVLVVEHDPGVTVGEIKEILILEGFNIE